MYKNVIQSVHTADSNLGYNWIKGPICETMNPSRDSSTLLFPYLISFPSVEIRHTISNSRSAAHYPYTRPLIEFDRLLSLQEQMPRYHDDVIKWKHLPRYWPFVWGIHRSPVDSPHKGQWRGALMFHFVCAWKNRWVNNREAGDLRRHRDHYDVTVMTHRNLIILELWKGMPCICVSVWSISR